MTDPKQVRRLFQAASAITDSRARARFLADNCMGDDQLHAEVERLLAANRVASGQTADLETDPTGAVPPTSVLGDPRPVAPVLTDEASGQPTALASVRTSIGDRYELLKKIGEGGMGSVWMAEQREPVRRKVAVKLIKPGFDSREVIKRFEAERQALALMDHPGIASVYDGGTTREGQPYFVMELVEGIPLNDFCDQQHLIVRARLNLFVRICQAVQHAHQKGIIHRDLKPSNVLVTTVDGHPVPKIIDFGVAKATEQRLTDETFGDDAAIVGTPTYMSPEQADPAANDVDTRSDVYALGVILYELLVGSPPIDSRAFKRGAVLEMLRMIREVDPPRPSTKLSNADNLPSVAATRDLEPGALLRWLRGDIDWIAMKALEKDRERRYDSPNALAADVLRHLSDEPVQARPPTRRYRMSKFVKRHRGPVIAASLLLLVLTGGIIGTTLGLIEARKAWRAEGARADGERHAKESAQQRLAQLETGNEILASIFTDLDVVRVAESGEPLQAVLAKRLLSAAQQLEGEAIGDPITVARMQQRLGRSLRSLGFPEEAIPLFEKARATLKGEFGVNNAETLQAMNHLASAHQEASDFDAALPIFIETLERRTSLLGADHGDTIASMNNLAFGYVDAGKDELAIPLYEQALAIKEAASDELDSSTRSNLAMAYGRLGKYHLALPVLEEVSKYRQEKLGLNHPDTLIAMNNLANCYVDVGSLDLALPLFEQTLELRREVLGSHHPATLRSLNNLAHGYSSAGRLDRAAEIYVELVEQRKRTMGARHPDTLRVVENLAHVHLRAGQAELAVPVFQEALEIRRNSLGNGHPDTISCMTALAKGYLQTGATKLAIPLLEEALESARRALASDHPTIFSAMNSLATAFESDQQYDRAIPLYEETLRLRKQVFGTDDRTTLVSMNNLALAYKRTGRLDLAIPMYEETLQRRKALLGDSHPSTMTSMHNLARAYDSNDDSGRAMPLYEEALRLRKAHLSRRHPEIVNGSYNVAVAYCKFDQGAKAVPHFATYLEFEREASEPNSPSLASRLAEIAARLLEVEEYHGSERFLRECLQIRSEMQPNRWTTFNTHSALGGALLGQRRFEEAEPWLVSGYAGMKEREETISPRSKTRLVQAVDRLIALHKMRDNADEVAKWQEIRATFDSDD